MAQSTTNNQSQFQGYSVRSRKLAPCWSQGAYPLLWAGAREGDAPSPRRGWLQPRGLAVPPHAPGRLHPPPPATPACAPTHKPRHMTAAPVQKETGSSLTGPASERQTESNHTEQHTAQLLRCRPTRNYQPVLSSLASGTVSERGTVALVDAHLRRRGGCYIRRGCYLAGGSEASEDEGVHGGSDSINCQGHAAAPGPSPNNRCRLRTSPIQSSWMSKQPQKNIPYRERYLP